MEYIHVIYLLGPGHPTIVLAEKPIMWNEGRQATAAEREVGLRQMGLEPSCSEMEMGETGRRKGREDSKKPKPELKIKLYGEVLIKAREKV